MSKQSCSSGNGTRVQCRWGHFSQHVFTFIWDLHVKSTFMVNWIDQYNVVMSEVNLWVLCSLFNVQSSYWSFKKERPYLERALSQKTCFSENAHILLEMHAFSSNLHKMHTFSWKCTKILDFQWEVPFNFKNLMGAVRRLLLGMGK